MGDPLVPGRALRALAVIGCVVMLAMLGYGMHYGYAVSQTSAIASIAWGQVLLADLYLGLALFSAWVLWRERFGARGVFCVVTLLLLGNLVACIYVLWALHSSRGDGRRFWHGKRAAPTS